MHEQASAPPKTAEREIDRVQQIVWEQQPFIYLVISDARAVSPNTERHLPSLIPGGSQRTRGIVAGDWEHCSDRDRLLLRID